MTNREKIQTMGTECARMIRDHARRNGIHQVYFSTRPSNVWVVHVSPLWYRILRAAVFMYDKPIGDLTRVGGFPLVVDDGVESFEYRQHDDQRSLWKGLAAWVPLEPISDTFALP